MAKWRVRLKFRPRALDRNAARRGSIAVEFALIAPVFFLFLIGTIELCLMLGAQQMLESAAFNTSRLGKTGYVETENELTQEQTVNQVLVRELQSYGSFFDVSRLTMTSSFYTSFSGISEGSGTTGLGGEEKIVVYRITYPWKIFTPMMCQALVDTCYTTPNGYFVNLVTTIVVRNEPYGGS